MDCRCEEQKEVVAGTTLSAKTMEQFDSQMPIQHQDQSREQCADGDMHGWKDLSSLCCME